MVIVKKAKANKTISSNVPYEIKSWSLYDDTGFMFRNSLFEAVKLIKNVDRDIVFHLI